MGIAGSGKSSLAKKLTKKLNAVWLNADKIRIVLITIIIIKRFACGICE